MADYDSTAVHSAPSTTTLLKISDAAKLVGLHPQTLRNYEEEGRISSVRLGGGGHRRYDLSRLRVELGLAEENCQIERLPAIYGRTSTIHQKPALLSQIDRMKNEVHLREGVPKHKILIFQDCASSYGNRAGLNSLCEAIIQGTVSKVYVEYRDRLSRIPGMLSLLRSIAKNRGVEIIIVETEETADSLKEAIEELLSFSQIVTNRICGARGGQATRRDVTNDQLKQCFLWRLNEKLSWQEIGRRIVEQGWVDQRGKKFTVSTANGSVCRKISRNWDLYRQLWGDGKLPTNSFQQFVEKYCVYKADSTTRFSRKKLVGEYHNWAKREKKTIIGNGAISKYLAKLGWKKQRAKNEHKRVCFVGLSVNTKQPR